ncbi:oligosaccharide flippase family protein [Specibacter sp. NPDC078692]|uniref:oligosaccharide flippase family protein n=1 Tax=Specibacter sp. NPDC078692 TaxID=3155818 RepID=UPI0034393F0D
MTESTNLSTPTLKNALAWSGLSNLVLRVGTLSMGIVLARILSPEDFGVYAVALTVQTILMTMADFGLSADLIRSKDHERRAPTVATLGVLTGLIFATSMAFSSTFVANSMGSPEASDVIFILSFTLVLSGVGIVPYAKLQRNFEQKKIFSISMVDFIVSTTVTILLLVLGLGVISLAYARIAAQACAVVLQFILARQGLKFGYNRSLVMSVLKFGGPIAAANLLSWSLLSVDNVVIARLAGPVSLGFYVLAFNISNWPMSALGQVIRSVSLPAFSRAAGEGNGQNLTTAVALTWGIGLPAGLFLAVLSEPLISLIYGEKWSLAAPVLAALGIFGAFRLVFDVWVAYLLACGKSLAVLLVQIVWFCSLIPAMIAATHLFGIVGGGWAHVVVGVMVVLPAYIWALRGTRADLRGLAKVGWPPVLAGVPTWFVAHFVANLVSSPILAIGLGGIAGGAVYVALLFRWYARIVRSALLMKQGANNHVADVIGNVSNGLNPRSDAITESSST